MTPNDRRVLEILAKAGKRLGVQEGIAFSGYGSKQEVLRQMQVIFEVIQEEQISYCYPAGVTGIVASVYVCGIYIGE